MFALLDGKKSNDTLLASGKRSKEITTATLGCIVAGYQLSGDVSRGKQHNLDSLLRKATQQILFG